jgi:DNA repair protein RecN (Recombination protein N)
MLTELHIENLGVIERVELVLGPGLIAVTGETGAGKTMIVEAIELLVGGRSDASMVRHGAAEARIDGRLVRADGTETVLSRVIPADGRARAYVDGRLATVGSLAEIATDVVDLHGQHAHQSLLSTATQRAALDEFGGIDLGPLREARARLTEIDAALAALGGDERARAREIDLLRFQVDELEAAAVVDAGEDAALDAEENVLADAVAHREAAERALGALADDGAARDSLAAALGALDGRAPFDDLSDRLRELLAEVDDLVGEIRARGEAIDESPQRLAEIRERRQTLRSLCRKYGDDLAAVMSYHRDSARRLHELERFDERAAELDGERHAALAAERRAAEAVGRRRREVAPALATAVQTELQRLAMPHVAIAIEIGEHVDDHPGDRVQILLAANPGSPLLPLTRVASGGELARAMLALRLVLSGATVDLGHDGARTLVFDEVDAGIGGTAAQAIGDALAELGRTHQVLVVTHLAQVAAAAGTQITVEKTVRDGETFAAARPIEGEQRVAELARMLSGGVTASALDHARELLGSRTTPPS